MTTALEPAPEQGRRRTDQGGRAVGDGASPQSLASDALGFDEAAWRRRMAEADIADELFLPLAFAEWDAGRWRLKKDERRLARTEITGVRYLAADPKRENPEPERATQTDFHRLLTSLVRLRAQGPDAARLCLSSETFRTSPFRSTPRLRFGLERRRQHLDDARAAKLADRAIRRSIRRAGFVIDEPTARFDPQTGLTGLRDWTDRLRLRRRKPWWLLLLLIPLLAALAFLPRCDAPAADFFGAPIETHSFVLLIDRSGSMEEHFAALQAEAARVLQALAAHGGCHADVIAYDAGAESCFGGIVPIDEGSIARIDAFLAGLKAGGGTNLASGLDLADDEVAAHGEPTTLILLTDAEDSSLPSLLADRAGLVAGFGGVETRAYGLTPEFFQPPADPAATATPTDRAVPNVQPRTDDEKRLAELAELLGGRFGPALR